MKCKVCKHEIEEPVEEEYCSEDCIEYAIDEMIECEVDDAIDAKPGA